MKSKGTRGQRSPVPGPVKPEPPMPQRTLRLQWAHNRFAVVSIGLDDYLVQRLAANHFQLTRLSPDRTLTFQCWVGGKRDECHCGTSSCIHIPAIQAVRGKLQ